MILLIFNNFSFSKISIRLLVMLCTVLSRLIGTLKKFPINLPSTVSLSRVWLNDEMNPGNDYYSSPDLQVGNQKAQKIEKFN